MMWNVFMTLSFIILVDLRF